MAMIIGPQFKSLNQSEGILKDMKQRMAVERIHIKKSKENYMKYMSVQKKVKITNILSVLKDQMD